MGSPTLLLVPPECPLDERSDDELMALSKQGRVEAFETLVRRHQPAVLRLGRKLLGDSSSAQDAAQATFIELYRSLGRYRPSGRFEMFMRRLALNQCRMAARRQRLTKLLPLWIPAPSETCPRPLVDAVLMGEEQLTAVNAALQSLSVKLREVVVLRLMEHQPLTEIAETLELPLGTVKSRLFAGLQKLRLALEKEGL